MTETMQVPRRINTNSRTFRVSARNAEAAAMTDEATRFEEQRERGATRPRATIADIARKRLPDRTFRLRVVIVRRTGVTCASGPMQPERSARNSCCGRSCSAQSTAAGAGLCRRATAVYVNTLITSPASTTWTSGSACRASGTNSALHNSASRTPGSRPSISLPETDPAVGDHFTSPTSRRRPST